MKRLIWGALLGLALCAATAGAQVPADAAVDQLTRRYAAALSEAVEQQWVRPNSVTFEQVCPVQVRMLPGGHVVEATAREDCGFDVAGRRSVEAAVRRAEPLPYAGFESVFRRHLVLWFRAKDKAPQPGAAVVPRVDGADAAVPNEPRR